MARKPKPDEPFKAQKAYRERKPQRTFALSPEWWARFDALRRDNESQAQTLTRAIAMLEGNDRAPISRADVLDWIKANTKEG